MVDGLAVRAGEGVGRPLHRAVLIVRLHQRPGGVRPAGHRLQVYSQWELLGPEKGVVSAELADHQPLNPGRQLDVDRHGDGVGGGLPVDGGGIGLLPGEAHAAAAAVAVAAAVGVHRAVGGLVDLIGVPDAVKIVVGVPVRPGVRRRAIVDGPLHGLAGPLVRDLRGEVALRHVGAGRDIGAVLVLSGVGEQGPALQAGEGIGPLLRVVLGDQDLPGDGEGPEALGGQLLLAVLHQVGVAGQRVPHPVRGTDQKDPHEPVRLFFLPLRLGQGAPRQHQGQSRRQGGQSYPFIPHRRPPISRRSGGCPPPRSPGSSKFC